MRWWLGPDASPDVAAPLLADALRQLEAGAANLRTGRRKQLYRLAGGPSQPHWLLKLRRYDRGDRWHRYFRESKARHELRIARSLRARGIDTPVPYAAGEARIRGRLDRCYLLTPVLQNARDLKELWAGGATLEERRGWIEAFGGTARRLHDVGLIQEDFAPNNFLLSSHDPPSVQPIDFERARLQHRVGSASRRRMLAVLDRHLAGASASDRLRFLHAYCGGAAPEARAWWRRLERERRRLTIRELARLERHACRDGRRFHRVEWNGWRGWARRGAPELPGIESRLRSSPEARPKPGMRLRFEPDGPYWAGAGAGSRADAQRLWATSLLLWGRGGLCPSPIACLQGEHGLCCWFARDSSARTLVQLATSEPARRAAAVLVGRLGSIGRLDARLDPRDIVLVHEPGGGLRAQLLDASAFRADLRDGPRGARRSRATVDVRLAPQAESIERIRKSAG
ncbi:MAG: lipopolysaccharide kinase InaA family protein [Myxococcota bacterium]